MFEMKSNAMMEVVEPGSYVALNSHTHFEMFYLYEVLEKCVAKEEIEEDDSGHLFTREEQYLKCRYLQPLKQKRTCTTTRNMLWLFLSTHYTFCAPM